MRSLLLFACIAAAVSAPLSLGGIASDMAAMKAIESASKDEGTLINAVHVGIAMERGWWKSTKKLIELCRDRGIDPSHVVHQKASAIRRHVKSTMELLNSPASRKSIMPAFQWAQSKDHLFLSVKFAHRIDAPAHLDCKDDHVNVTGRTVHLIAPCRSGRSFELRLDLLKDVDTGNSSWSLASVGRMTFTLAKAEADNEWARLLRSRKKPSNMHTWWDMKHKFEGELRNLTARAAGSANASAAVANATKANATTDSPGAGRAAGGEGAAGTPLPDGGEESDGASGGAEPANAAGAGAGVESPASDAGPSAEEAGGAGQDGAPKDEL